ncbi:hypothetical protein GGI43DRAFT_266372 [Trichoderma evansii]
MGRLQAFGNIHLCVYFFFLFLLSNFYFVVLSLSGVADALQALLLVDFYCSTVKGEKPIIHEALEALPERWICISTMGFNGTLGDI